VLLLVALLLAAATDLTATSCVSLPRTGPVRARTVDGAGAGDTLVDYTPAGPRAGSGPVPLVDNWLTSMTATPLNTYVAREFLTTASSTSWVPERGTLAYGSQQLVAGPGGVVLLRLRDVVSLDARGAWQGDPTSGRGVDYRLRLVKEDGQWRISDPPNRLLVPRSHLDTQYEQFRLYFFDRSGQVLVPEPVYVPRGRQAPTVLLAGLLKGPEPGLDDVERTFFPPGTALDGISVPVTRSGTADVPLGDRVLDVDSARLKLVFAQMAWTLGQVPGVQRLRVTVNGAPLDPPGVSADVNVDDFSEYDPSVAWAATDLFGVRDRRVVTDDSQGEGRVSGPFGVLPVGPRSIAVDPLAQHIAAVTPDGRRVLESDRDGVSGRAARPSDIRTLYAGGTDLLRPAYDMYGQLWCVDRTRSGARLLVARGGVSRPVDVLGVTGARVSRFLVSRDGTRLVAELRRAGIDELVTARVRRDLQGGVVGATRARRLHLEGLPGRIQDIAWRTPTDLAVLVAPSPGSSEVLLAKVDGSSTAAELGTDAALFRGRVVRLVSSPSTGTPLYVATSTGRLYALSARGRWKASTVKPGLGAPTFVG
jgi:Lipoprotein LpqB beta-propeller domain/Sporulation and spore germination